ncbi:MAG: hypothetical protein ABDH59_07490 [Fervidobacterium sp.]
MKEKRRKSKYFFSYQNSKAFRELKKMSKDDSFQENNSQTAPHLDRTEFFLQSKLAFSKELKEEIVKLFFKMLRYFLPILGVEFLIFLVLKLWSALLGLFMGSIAAFLGLVLLVKSYKSYGIIALGTFKVPKTYGLRYLFYASIFLLVAILSTDPVWGIIGTFIGMINLKIVIFLFSWRW